MSVLNFDTGVQSFLEILQNARDHFCSNFVPRLLQSAFQRFNRLVLGCAGFLLHDPPDREVERVEIWRIREPNVLRPESRKIGLTPFDRFLSAVSRGPVLLKPPVDVFSVFFSPGDDGPFQNQQNQLPIRLRVRLFGPLSVFMDNPVKTL
ncbi:hypothetical protein L596_022638 [Steinernema carpocapsae]|uniref:Uncharacterized protein n=1 Tax=Steinernema carpocapsae TaxID=34508 RepID=A0A4U5MMC4_STECR|nr:hypothetical protein L596_022638 [Steinernema carpocapsae]